MDPKRIFSFWEPRNEMAPYLRLCMDTWDKTLPDYDIVLLDNTNLHEYLPDEIREEIICDKLRLGSQKNALQIAVLKTHGGLFVDVDTLFLNDIRPILDELENTEVVLFHQHLAFMAAKRDAHLLTLWLEELKKRVGTIRRGEVKETGWGYIGNGILDEMMKQATPDLMVNLDKLIYAFTPETVRFPFWGGPRDKYLRFWFEDDLAIDDVFFKKQRVIGLHNSWTPEWYKELSREEVLEHDCLLSRTLRHILESPGVIEGKEGVSLQKRLAWFAARKARGLKRRFF
ncbi:capsular polysaccharide synthesis protein [Gemmatimonadota bacterium]